MTKKNAVAKVETGSALAGVQSDLGAWGESTYCASDVVIPRLQMMQGTSKMVQDGKAHVANIVDSMSAKVLGGPDKPINIVPFHMIKCWTVSQKVGDKFVYLKKDTWTPANDNQAWEQTIQGVVHKFEKTYDFYVLLEDDTSLPYVLSMKSTSARAAKELATQMFTKNKMDGLVPPAKVIKLSVERIEKNGNKYAVYKTSVEKDTPKETIQLCYGWFKTVSAGQFKAHEAQDEEGSSAQSTHLSDVESQF